MRRKIKVLWVEDGARYDLAHLAAPVYMDRNYDLIIAENTSAGVTELLQNTFDVIIVDIRMPPGDDPNWIKLYQEFGAEKVSARLGLHFLYTILGHPDARVKLGNKRPAWIKPAKVGVLTVESHPELDEDLKKLGVTVYHHKRVEMSEEILLNLIEEILAQAEHGEKGPQ